ncbi:arylamine N-acetyltransferase family protein [Georgenia deserti]|uniref:Arylamine N-acetyltransferase n=1 Tax=Georgenia deserti TaxID=2093781 RepID=A0ABW4L978_9MICO
MTTPMPTNQLREMLRRIGLQRPVRVDAGSLRDLHRAWRQQVPYENVDIQLGRPISLDQDRLHEKIVKRRRGGYCFEQNGALAVLLRASGFQVTLVEGAVLREQRGEDTWGNHNVLLVDVGLDRWVADGGIGDGFLDPIPLREGVHHQDGYDYRLERLDSSTWRFHHHPGGSIASYDFRTEPRTLADFSARNLALSTSPDSPYVRLLVIARSVGGETLLLVSRTLRRIGPDGASARTIPDKDEFARVLADELLVPVGDIGADGVDRLWAAASEQHDGWLQHSRAVRGRDR